MNREPERRFRDAAEAFRALEPLLDERQETEQETETERSSLVVRPTAFLTLLILSCLLAGLSIYWLLRSMHI